MEYNPEPIMPPARPFMERYVGSVIHHPVSQFVTATVVELVKIVAAKMFLEILLERALGQAKMPVKAVWTIAVAAPVIEEIIFRGVLQRGVGLVQKGWNHFVTQRELSQEELAVQRTWRIQITAIVFAAAHLMNPHSSTAAKLTQFTWCYVGGVAYGYLSDKYKTLSVSILAHGFNNMLALCIATYADPRVTLVCLAAVVINPIASYTLGKPEWVQNTATSIREFSNVCLSMPYRVFNSLNLVRTPVPEMV
ncbi:hypothetical protein PNK_1925 [Candidatus Protochlamydia naegleriophila]|uniref:CAAX prenyl protease 2/Lysostaphin resistance protein A-like domain-containing protein n=1 Tax=Candidatus Protochlamydia naegleriophila TaxID=389348 RepID=A0A0U5JFC6_9BACT|nr:CPBP family intramembrane glutamic endopeptidase [Candidatus Protochlamydia naegleriophila]CUI17530.1 hypothetical protein PNK_1925 [Candidatus Protochlamydia naegleriophila]